MRVIAHNVEYFDLMRDRGTLVRSPSQSLPESFSGEGSPVSGLHADRGLRDSLWYFDGENMQCWMDVEDVLMAASPENDRDIPDPVSITNDFYPTSVMLDRGVVLGLDTEMIQRRDVHFAFIRHAIRVCRSPSMSEALADYHRHNYSYPIFCADICWNMILPPPLSSLFAIRTSRISLTHWNFSYTRSLMTRLTVVFNPRTP